MTDIPQNPILQGLLAESQRQAKQIELLNQQVQAYVVDDIPRLPWLNHRSGGVGCEGCGHDPVWEVLAHQIGDCEADNVDIDGNFRWRGCDRCYRRWRAELRSVLHRLHRYLPVPCPSCQRPIMHTTDVLLYAKPIGIGTGAQRGY